MRYKKITIEKYKGVVGSDLPITDSPIPIIGVNESGKSSALEALAHFDWRNDEIIAARNWKFLNRYKPKETTFKVVADIEIAQDELDKILAANTKPKEEPPVVEEPSPVEPEAIAAEAPAEEPSPSVETPAPEAEAEPTETEEINEVPEIRIRSGRITVARVFESSGAATMTYTISDAEGEVIERIARDIINTLPRIYFIGDFLEDHMPDEIMFPPEYAAGDNLALSEHQKIIEGAFRSADLSLRDCLNNEDEDTRKTWMSAASATMTDKIIDDWNKMQLGEGELDVDKPSNVTIELGLSENKERVSIKIMEQFHEGSKEFPRISTPLNERSQGFRWFFNFSAMKCFAALGQEQFIYLFDEPGSYLHNSAQKILLKAIIDLAKQHPVIFATHSEFLLDPDHININDIRVVQKENHEIKLIPLSNARTKKHEGALSTLNHALRLRTPLETIMKKKVVVTEGITDFYFWKPVVDVVYLPGYGAGNNKYLLSLAIGASQSYVALFDGDEAGDKAMTQYKGYFGNDEAAHWLQYRKSDSSPAVLEDLLSNADTERLHTITGQTDTKRAITVSFFQGKAKEFWSGVDDETLGNITINIAALFKPLKLTAKELKLVTDKLSVSGSTVTKKP